jgi:hypothetical protein
MQSERCDVLRDGILRVIENFRDAFGDSDEVALDAISVLGFLGGSLTATAPDIESLHRAHKIFTASIELGFNDVEGRGQTKH